MQCREIFALSFIAIMLCVTGAFGATTTNYTLSYDLVISPDMTAITSGDSFDFSAASIDTQQGLEIGMKVTQNFLTAADGFYLDTLTFKASLESSWGVVYRLQA